MKKKLLYLFCSLFLILGSNLSYGQGFSAKYGFDLVTATSGTTDPTTPPAATGVTFGAFTANGVSANANTGIRFSFTAWPLGATNGVDTFTGTITNTSTAYYEVTITPDAAKNLTLATMTFTWQRSSTGVRQCAVRSSIDSYGANLPASIVTTATSANLSVVSVPLPNTFQVSDASSTATDSCKITFPASFASLTAPVTIRIYGFNAEAATGTHSIDNVIFNGWTSSAVAATPTLTANPTSLDFGATTPVNGSAVKTFSLSSTNLTAGATLTTAAPFSISTDGTTYSTSATITAATLATAQTISVKFSPTNTTAATGNVSITSTGATTQTVPLTGTGATPTLTVSSTSLIFTSQAAGTTSTAQTFTVGGAGLSTNTTVSVAAPFAVSKDGTTYSTLITYTPAELATAQTVSVVFAPTAAGSPTGTITVASAGATSKTVAVSGTATAAVGGGTGAGFSAKYPFDLVTATSGTTDPTTPPTATGVTFGAFTANGVSANANTGIRFSFTAWPLGATNGVDTFTGTITNTSTAYYEVTITPDAAKNLTLATMTFTWQRSSTGVRQCAVRSSIDSYGANLPASIVTTATSANLSVVSVPLPNTFQVSDASSTATDSCKITFPASFASLTAPVTIRIYGFNAEAATGTHSIDNVIFNGWTSSVGSSTPAPALVASQTSLDFGTTQTINTTSAAKTFTLSGTNLTAGATLTTAAPYRISIDNTTFGTTASFTASQLATAQTVYVQFSPTVTTPTTGSVDITSAGAVGQGVILTGTGSNFVAVPTLVATPTTLAYGNVNAGLTSVKTFTLAGSTLTSATTTVAATAPYTVSKDGTTYAASVTYSVAELTATTAPTVSVKFSPTAAGAANSTVTITNTEVTAPPTVTVTGTGVIPVLIATTTPATTPTVIDFSNQTITTSLSKSYVLSGTNLTGTTTVTSTGDAAYTVSKTSAGPYTSSITFTTAELALNPTVFVQFLPTTLGAIAGNIANSTAGTGAVTLNVALTGTSVAAPVPTLTLAPSSLTFSQQVTGTSTAQSYTITGVNITGATTVTVTAPYSISKTSGGTYGTSLSYTTADFPSGSGVQTVFVKFSPTLVGTAAPNLNSIANATAGGSIQTLVLNGTGVGIPALTVAPTTPLTFTSVIGTPAPVQSYTLSGVYLTANATVTVAAPYSVSKTATGTFGTTLTYTPTELATAQTVYVQFSPTVIAVGGVNNGTALNVSTGAANQTVTLNGTGLGVPALTVAPSILTFTQGTGSASAAQSFTLTGAYLTANATLTTTAPYGISKTSTGTFSTTLSYTPAELATAQTVYVIFTPTIVGAANGTVSVASTGATSQTVTLTGTGINSAPTLGVIADQNVCSVTTPATIALTGITVGPTAETASQTITSLSVTSNNTALFASLGVTPVIAGASTLSYTIANGQTGTAVVAVTVKDNGGVANGGVDTYTRTFNVTVNALAQVTITSDAANNIVDKGSVATLTATGGTTYAWTSNASITSGLTTAFITIRPTTTTTYTVVATNASGCTTTQTIAITVRNASKLETGNVLTPNGDGKNDYWVVRNIDLYPGNIVKVFDKSGKLVFTKNGYNNDWNGYYNGSPLPQGTYYYVVDLGTGLPFKGTLSVVRD